MITVTSDSLGWFHFDGLLDGTYIITGMDVFSWKPEKATIELKGSDARTPDFIATSYIGPMNYVIAGRAVDKDGNGIADVSIYWQKTDRNGSFQIYKSITKSESGRTYTFTPQKEWYTFTPESAKVTLEWKEKYSSPDTVTIPDFIGSGYPIYFAADYFPLRTGASWTYERAKTGETTREYTVSISGKTASGGVDYFHSAVPGPAELSDFRLEDNSVRTSWRNQDTEFLRFGAVPNTRWEIGLTSRSYPITGTFMGVETVTVPAGTYADCAKFEIRTTYGESTYELYTLWFAKDTGMVRSEYALVNYGGTKDAVTLALVKFTP